MSNEAADVPSWAVKTIVTIMPVLLSVMVGFSGWIALSVSQLNARVGIVIEAQGWHQRSIDKNEKDIDKNRNSIEELKKRIDYK